MQEPYADPSQQYFSDVNTRVKDLEEKQRLLKDRILLIGQNLISEREDSSKEIQEIKKIALQLKEENLRMKEFLQRVAGQLSESARREELMMLKRQFDMIEPHIKKEK